jgi:hypothetical protein
VTTSVRAFRRGLYAEHLEEASFLYEQRRALLVNPELAWTQIGDFEGRIEAHIDAVVVGGDIALDVCRERVAEGDPGELLRRCAFFAAMLSRRSWPSCCKGWTTRIPIAFARSSMRLSTSCRKVGTTRVGVPSGKRGSAEDVAGRGDRLSPDARRPSGTLLSGSHPDAQRALLWAIGRTRETGAGDAIRPFYRAAETQCYQQRCETGLRIHDPEALRHLRANANGGQSLQSNLSRRRAS